MDNVLLYFIFLFFRRVFVEFVVPKIWSKNIDFYRYRLMLARRLFPPPPPLAHQEMINAI